VNELAKASTAMKSFMSGFKIVSGIEDSRSRPSSIAYTYDFAYLPLKRAEPVVEAAPALEMPDGDGNGPS
jgi:hypothetical protein